mmetsp:Transcript_3073/g.8537  ORF Transcript_3073/g.8537 Transcript_3073/m.8537 type:complete len:142 (+) Transcript_3073:39-464(+)|eukprot:CAMPEP_0115865556 /NCGR_PEP_ID=MMETSP0287-20121206/19783_1 /TAXON_ID=412157 /ORGANISM="Chrysochromulina rotalis, Strain UIO044" /LENGTH=141 /DNA_ID=CAMNT_0003320073 /DNA_START=22 /DNA_END=447 /DNA_ORIENTATION=-
MSEELPCCIFPAKAGQTVGPAGCGLNGGVTGPIPIVLARDVVGIWQEEKTPCVKIDIGGPGCGDNCFCVCCYAGPIPCFGGMFSRDCTDTCKHSNSFCGGFGASHGHYYTFHDKDTMYYHYLCCPKTKYVRVGSAKVEPAP